jgi:hypothetical protein
LVAARVYSLIPREPERDTNVVIGTIPIFGFRASVLFDSRATHSFLSSMFVTLFGLFVRTLEVGFAVATSVGKTVTCSRIALGCPININERILLANLVVLALHGYDLLGMNLLAKYFASINCARKLVTLKPWGVAEITFIGLQVKPLPLVVSAAQAREPIINGGQTYLAFIIEVTKKGIDIQEIHVVHNFLDIFSMDFSGLPLEKGGRIRNRMRSGNGTHI